MSTQTLKLIKTDSNFLDATAIVIDSKWYHQPYWYEKIGEGLFIQYKFDELPEELKQRIQQERESLK